MKQIKLLFLFFYLISFKLTFSQTPEFNLQKYWFYRERFKNFFVSIGTEPGQSLAVSMMTEGEECSPNLVNPNSTPITGNTFRLDDLPVHQGWYIGVLATEYALLKQHNRNTDDVKHELFCALYALNRLDLAGEKVGDQALNGFMIREDFPVDFFALHPEIQAPDDEIIQEKWNVNRCTNHGGFSNECFHKLSDPEAPYFGTYNEMALSMDHYARILMGLALVTKFVDLNALDYKLTEDGLIINEFQDGENFLRFEAQKIADRIVSYFKDHKWILLFPGSELSNSLAEQNIPYSSMEQNCLFGTNIWGSLFGNEPCRNCAWSSIVAGDGSLIQGVVVPRGANATHFSFGFNRAGGAIKSNFNKFTFDYANYNDIISTSASVAWNGLSDLHAITEPKKAGNRAYISILAAIGDSWIPTLDLLNFIDQNSYKWGVYSMLNAALWDKDFEPNYDYSLERMNTAPCKGPDRSYYTQWNDNNAFDVDSYNTSPTESGEVKCNGLDYMLLHNLYLLTHPNYVQYNRVNIGDMYLAAEIPYVIPFPSCAPNYFTAVGTLSTGSSSILPDQLEYLCVGQINTNQKIRPKNLSGPYVGYDQCFLNSLVYINVNTNVDAVPFVTYKATNDVILGDEFEGLEGIEFWAKAIEFKCNAAGDAYERLAGSIDSTSNDKGQRNFLKNDNTKDLVSKNNELPIRQSENKTYNSKPFFNIYPNPNEGVFKVEYSTSVTNLNNINLILYDIMGNELLQKETEKNNSKFLWEINLTDLIRGVYIIKLVNQEGVLETKRMVVK